MAEYKGSVELIGGLKPKNDLDFPLCSAHQVQVDETGKRLDEKLLEIGNGESGNDGEDGGYYTPSVEVLPDESETKIIFSNMPSKEGMPTVDPTRFDIPHGKDGKDGKDGADGKDGKDGANGKDGTNGKDGANGADGGYYTPSVSYLSGETADTMYFGYNPSKAGMPTVDPTRVDIPHGKDGKSAYAYAKDGGYTGTESEFSEKLAEENPTMEDFNSLSKQISEMKASGIIIVQNGNALTFNMGGAE